MQCETYLLLVLTLLSILSDLLPTMFKTLIGCFNIPNSEEKALYSEMLCHKSEQNQLSMQGQFAAYSKLERKIIKLEDQLKSISQSRHNKLADLNHKVSVALGVILGVSSILVVIYYRHTPVCVLDQNLYPLDGLLRYPTAVPGAVSPYFWAAVTRTFWRYTMCR